MQDLMQIFRDSIWNSAAVIVTIFFGIISLWVAWKQLQRKLLVYEVVSKNNILDMPAIHNNGIEVRFNSNPIRKFYVILIKFSNKGNVTIEKSDFEGVNRSITVEFGQDVGLLSAEIINPPSKQRGLSVSLQKGVQRPGYVSIDPFLLNSDESFTLQITADDFQQVNVNGDIKGINKISESKTIPTNFNYLIILFPALILGYFLAKLPLILLLIILSIVILGFFFFAIQSTAGV